MAYDKVVDSAALEAGLTQIADAIREKGGTSDNLAFPAAMAEAIAAIAAGGGGGVKIATGSFTPTEDVIYQSVTHNLGVVPSFLAYFQATEFEALSGSILYIRAASGYNAGPINACAITSSSTKSAFFETSKGFDVNDNIRNRIARSGEETTITLKLIVDGMTNPYFKGGTTYNWIAIGGLT